MSCRKRLAVHRVGDQRNTPVAGDVGRESRRPTIDRPADDLGGLVPHPGPFEQRSEGNALPDGVVDQVTANFVGNALERDGFLDRVESEQFVVGE